MTPTPLGPIPCFDSIVLHQEIVWDEPVTTIKRWDFKIHTRGSRMAGSMDDKGAIANAVTEYFVG